MRTYDIFLTIFILIIFLLLYLFNIMVVQMSDIQQNWPLYRCNPSIMPFSGYFGVQPGENFTYCIQNMQTNFMSYLLEPVHYSLSLISNMGGGLSGSVNKIRSTLSNLRDLISNIIQSIYGVFLNILIEFQKIIISLKDMVGKTMGIVATLLYTIEGTMYTIESAWGSPAGDVMRSLCFHPHTKIKLQNNDIKLMKFIDIGDILEDGSVVCATMKIKNKMGNKNKWGNQIENMYNMEDNIYVTGNHLVKYFDKWIKVKEHPHAILVKNMEVPILYCLITDTHKIPIGKYIFHDWEDDNGSPSKDLY